MRLKQHFIYFSVFADKLPLQFRKVQSPIGEACVYTLYGLKIEEVNSAKGNDSSQDANGVDAVRE